MTLPELNQIYRSTDDIRFAVKEQFLGEDGHPWTAYKNILTDVHYSVRTAAFLARYTLACD